LKALRLSLKILAILNIKTLLYLSLLFMALLDSSTSIAQGTYQFGLMPSINFNKKLEKDWAFNIAVQSRQVLLCGEFDGPAENGFDYILTDYSILAAKKFGLNSKINLGFLLRVEKGDVFQRLIQRYVVTQRLRGFRLSHRFTTDQTLSEVEPTEFRLRYRLTSEIPLNGQSLDPKEVYLKVNTEVLNSLKDSDYGLELRLVPVIGYDIRDSNKIEIGLDYRISSFLEGDPSHVFWAVIGWYLEF